MTDIIELTPHEEAVRQAGYHQGLAEGYGKFATDLAKAAEHYRANYTEVAKTDRKTRRSMDAIENLCRVMESMAAQLTEHGAQVRAKVPGLIQQAVSARSKVKRTLSKRASCAIIGAVNEFKR